MRRWNRAIIAVGDARTYFLVRKSGISGMKVDVFVFNTMVLIGSMFALLGLLHWILRRQLEVRRT